MKWIAARLVGRVDWPGWYGWDLWREDMWYRLHPLYERPQVIEFEGKEMIVMVESRAPLWKMPFIKLGWFI